jgi:hypothetical protein
MPGPAPRSACQLAALQDGALVFGGYSRERVKGERFCGKVTTAVVTTPIVNCVVSFRPFDSCRC